MADVKKSEGDDQLARHAKWVQREHPGKRITYMIEGLPRYLEVQKTRMDRIQKRRLLGGEGEEEAISEVDAARLRVTKKKIDSAAVWLQVNMKFHIRMTKDVAESSLYVLRLTTAIANAPYRYHTPFAHILPHNTDKFSFFSKGGEFLQ